MTALLLDTHAWTWSLRDSPCLSSRAREALTEAEVVYVSPISFFEIARKVRLGKWPEMNDLVHELPQLLIRQGALLASLTAEVSVAAGTLEWSHRDPFDRLLAATSLESGIPLLSADTVFDELSDRTRFPARIW